MMRLVTFVAGTIAGALLVAACSSSESLTSTSATAPPTSATTTTTSTTTTTLPPTTTPTTSTTTSTTTTPGSTTSTTAPPSNSTAPAATTTTEPAPSLPAPTDPPPPDALAVAGPDLVAIDPATGAVDRVVSEAFGADGVFRQGLELVPDRTAAYYSEGYEDSWFACETAIGSVGRVDVATGDTELLYSGWSPTLSADGTRLAYLTASTCLPDPIQPDQFFVAPFDTVVVVDLATATQVEITTAQPPTGLDDPGALDWVVFEPSGDLLVVTVDDQVHRVPSTAPAVVQDQPVVISAFTAEPVGVVGNDLLALEYGDEGSSTLLSIDLDTEASTELWTSDGFVAAGVSAAGHVVASDPLGDGPITEGGLTVVTIDDFVFSIDW